MPISRFNISAITAATLLMASQCALAQQAQAGDAAQGDSDQHTAVLPTVNVTASAMQTTTGMELTVKETPQSVTVVSKPLLDEQGITTMENAMRSTTGINVIRDGGSARVRFQSRGFYIDQMQEDGISSTVPGSSSNPSRDPQSMTDLAVYEHIEVVRGPTGLTQANGEPGGTINAVRKKPTAKRQVQADMLVDRWGKVRLTGDISSPLNATRTLRGRLIGVAEKSDSFKDRVDGNLGLIYGVMDWQIRPSTILTAGALYQQRKETPDLYGVPMGLGGSESGLPRRAYLGTDWTRATFKKANVFADLEHYFSDDWKITNKINWISSKSDSKTGFIYNGNNSYAGLPAGGTLSPSLPSSYVNDGKQASFQSTLTGKYEVLGRKHDLFAGYTYSYEDSTSERRQFNASGNFDPFTFQGNEIAEPNWGQGSNYYYEMFYGTKIISNALMLGTRFNATERLHIIAGTRYTRWRYSAYDDYSWYNGRVDNDATLYAGRKRNRFVPYLGVTFDLDASNSLYASYTSIFKPNANKDRDGNYLKPVLGNNVEVGWKAAWMGGRLATTLALFNIEQKNRSVSVQDPLTQRWYNQPIGHVRSRGLDAEISGHITPAWQLFAGYTYNRSKYLKTESSRYTEGMNYSLHTPRHMLRLYTTYRLPGAASRWSVGGGINAQSKTNSVYGVAQGGYAVLNANVQYQLNKNMKLNFIVKNLGDRLYYENNRVRTNGINNFRGEPRTFMLSLSWKM